MKQFVLLLLLTGSMTALFAQRVVFGVTGGVALTDTFRWQGDQSRRYVVGPSVELKLPAGFAVEFDALYRRLGTSSSFYSFDQTYMGRRQRGDSWEFPLLGKYYFRRKDARWQPFVSTGYAFRKTWWHADITPLAPTRSPYSFDYDGPVEVGAVAGAGVRYKLGRILLTPQVRYSRLSGDTENVPNQASFLLGIHF